MNNLLKICGITTKKDAKMVLSFSENKPEYLGFVFFEKSKRYISWEDAKKIVSLIREKFGENRVKFVGVFVNENLNNDAILEKYSFLDVFQLHGDSNIETPEFCMKLKDNLKKIGNLKKTNNQEIWKAFRVKNKKNLSEISEYFMTDVILIDAFSDVKNEYGGSGKQVNVEILPLLRSSISLHQKLFIAGGINIENKDTILALSGADGIDLSSSVESFVGVKSEYKIKGFLDS